MSNATKPGSESNATPDLAAERESASKAERARIQGITGCEEAKGREQMASHLAFNTTMSVEDAKALLGTAPKVEPKAEATNPLAAAMATSKQPNLGADGTEATGEQASGASGILAAARMAGVRSFELPAKQ